MSVWPALPAGCLPRCSGATLTAVQMCGMDDVCFDNALLADTTAAGTVDVGMGMNLGVDCGGNGDNFSCLTWQNLSCIGDSCPAELNTYIECASMVPMGGDVMTACATQITGLNDCQMANSTALSTCGRSRVVACFDTGGGFVPSRSAELSLPAFDLSSLSAQQLRSLQAMLAD